MKGGRKSARSSVASYLAWEVSEGRRKFLWASWLVDRDNAEPGMEKKNANSLAN